MMRRNEVFAAIDAERARQDSLWPRDDHPLVAQYRFVAPHLLLLKRYIDRSLERWQVSRDEEDIKAEVVKIAAIAVRALEETDRIDVRLRGEATVRPEKDDVKICAFCATGQPAFQFRSGTGTLWHRNEAGQFYKCLGHEKPNGVQNE